MMPRSASRSESGSRGSAIVSIICGVAGLAVMLIEPTLAVLLGLAGFILGVVARRGSARSVAVAGLVLNAALLLLVVILVATTTGIHTVNVGT